MKRQSPWIIALTSVVLMCGCSTGPTVPDSTDPTIPYWADSNWTQALYASIQQSVAYPNPISSESTPIPGYNLYGNPVIANELPSGQGTVGFDYQDGWLIDVKMVSSTGSSKLDDAIIKGVKNTKPPRVSGDYRSVLHHFEYTLDMKPSADDVRLILYNRIVDNLKLPKSDFPAQSVMVYIRADYLNGAFVSMDTDQPDGYGAIVADIQRMVKSAPLPAAPTAFKDQTIRVDMRFCLYVHRKPCDFDQEPKWADFSGLTYTISPDEE